MSDKNLFMIKYGHYDDVVKKMAEHPDYGTRTMALSRVYKEQPEHPDYKRLIDSHLTKTFETGSRTLTSINLDSPYLTGKHLDIIASKFDEKDPRNQQLYRRMRDKVKYKKDLDDQ